MKGTGMSSRRSPLDERDFIGYNRAMKPLTEVQIHDGFWKEIRTKNATISLKNIYEQFKDTRFRALDLEKTDPPSHIFYDSDVAKWLESAAYFSVNYPDGEIENIVHETVQKIVSHALPCGYFNSYYQVYKPDRIFRDRTEHELYCAGHLIEAAVALDETGLDHALLPAMEKYADYIYTRFFVRRDTAFTTCGHPEIELALVRLYLHTKKRKYLRLAKFFLDERGVRAEEIYSGRDREYDQSHRPVRTQSEIVGHAVRALYLTIAMADVGRICRDEELFSAAHRLFESAVHTKLYVTGGTGSNYEGEQFTEPYDLPNEYAYSETCSAVALALLCGRLAEKKNNAEYHEVFERVLYNNLLAAQSLDGRAFFYTNPLQTDPAHLKFAEFHRFPYQPDAVRSELFKCSCCPPNLTRFFGSLEKHIYGTEGGAFLVNQYISSEGKGGGISVSVRTGLPFEGKTRILAEGKGTLRFRVPKWSQTRTCTVNGKEVGFRPRGGYFSILIDGKTEIDVDWDPRLRFVYADGRVAENSGKRAVEFGPLVLCAESADNPFPLHGVRIRSLHAAKKESGTFPTAQNIPSFSVEAERLKTGAGTSEKGDLYSYRRPTWEKCTLVLVPYFAWANRRKGEMRVWFL